MENLKEHDDQGQAKGSLARRTQQAEAIVSEVIEQRHHGHEMPDSEVIAAHPELAEELQSALPLAGKIRKAYLSGMRMSPAPHDLELLTDSQIDAKIEFSSNDDDGLQWETVICPRLLGYFISDEISHGGQATVYKAVQESTGRTVAIKVVPGGPFIASKHRTRFEREQKILATLEHPNIVSIIDGGQTPDGSHYFVMQYVEGLSLDDYWKTIPSDMEGTRQVIQLFAKIASAVEEAHARGIIHRDLKPSNIIVDRRGEPHVLDFGLARSSHDEALLIRTITNPGQIVGSLPWASPEQAAGGSHDLDIRSDVYSLGVILFQSLTGEFPHSLDGPIDEILARIRTAHAIRPSKRKGCRHGIDRVLDAIVLKVIAKQPEDRYESAGCAGQDLEAWLKGSPPVAAPALPRRALTLLLVGLGIIFSVIGVLETWKTNPPLPQPVFALPAIDNSVGMHLVLIPSGRFFFGSPATEIARDSTEHLRSVSIRRAFYVGATEVTQRQYEEVMHDNPSDVRWLGAALPVQNVTWNEATAFCTRLSQMEHWVYRLPTEIEWEYACRANSTNAFSDGAQPDAMGWFSENSDGHIKPVAQKSPNLWGLFDMHGNVAEWCADFGEDDADHDGNQSIRLGMRAIRGGSALLPMSQARSAARRWAVPIIRFPDVGFRVVRES